MLLLFLLYLFTMLARLQSVAHHLWPLTFGLLLLLQTDTEGFPWREMPPPPGPSDGSLTMAVGAKMSLSIYSHRLGEPHDNDISADAQRLKQSHKCAHSPTGLERGCIWGARRYYMPRLWDGDSHECQLWGIFFSYPQLSWQVHRPAFRLFLWGGCAADEEEAY